MSQTDPFDPALAALLGADRPPPLSAGFADRLVAAAEGRGPALPPLRRTPASGRHTTRRVALGAGLAVVLSSAAAATGLLQQVGIALPPPVQQLVDDVAQTVTGRAPEPAPAVALAPVAARSPVVVQGAIDQPEELEAVFSQADARRVERTDLRRAAVDQRIDSELERRRAAGLPVPSADREAALRQRLDDARIRRDAADQVRREALRNELREVVDQGEPLTRETLRQAREDAGLAPAPRLAPARRDALRQRLAERRGLAPDLAPATPPESPAADNLP